MAHPIPRPELPAARETPTLKPAPAPAPAAPAPARRRRGVTPVRLAVVAVILLAALVFGGWEMWWRMTHVYEYDARVTADMVTMSSRAEGWVTEMPALEGMSVGAGEVVVKIDDRIAKLRADALRAQVQGMEADRVRLQAERQMVANQADAKTRTRASGVKVTEAARAAVEADLLLAKQELDRTKSLYDRGVITDKQLQTAQAALSKLTSQRQRMEAERAQAEGTLEEAKAERDRLAVIDGQLASLEHAQANLNAQLEQQLVDIADRTIRSPVPAVVDRTFVEPGEYVAPAQRILLLHNPNEVWVEANIKETQLRKLKLGQPVTIAVDAYPDDKFVGKVTRIGSSTTARFALLPTPNPSGNFTKITQRVPVKIDLVEMPKPLSPGMMVEVDIDIR